MNRLAIGFLLTWMMVGCIEGTNLRDDTEAASVAVALTDNVMFEGGTVIEGAIPATTEDTVTIAALEQTVIMTPGEASSMAVEAANPREDEDPITATLVQFAGDSRHIRVQARDNKTPAAQTGRSRIENAFMVEAGICDNLCNTTFFIGVTESTMLDSGAVGSSATRMVELDCGDAGSETFCDGSEGDRPNVVDTTGDASVGEDRPLVEGVITIADVQRFIEQQRQFDLAGCGCDGTCPDGTLPAVIEMQFKDLELCLGEMVVPGTDWLNCRLDYGDTELACEEEAMCDNIALDGCDQLNVEADADCGLLPDEIAVALTNCGFEVSGESMGDMPLDGFMCGTGEVISGAQVCDSIPDCPDRSDELDCGAGVDRGIGEFDCGDGTSVPVVELCDMSPACADGQDELMCAGELFMCTDLDTVPVDWVCDGTPDCLDGSDEAVCFQP